MSVIYRLNANEIDSQFLDDVKTKFAGKNIKIVVSEIDETEYLLSSKANRDKLINAIENINNRQNWIEVNLEDLL
ncbi:hypothetical protein [Laspinema palackyanum]|uniref:hypothetical protein n=1 Tax=Laspinema palackyanum TaxID=3231601 RepID=UPI00345D9C96|nr:hypothetical protein [Laspinema sp. D2c]